MSKTTELSNETEKNRIEYLKAKNNILMKNLLLILILAFTFTVSKASEKEIIAEVIFENLTGKELKSGEFYVTETNVKIEINSLENFKITLPKKGKYQFRFATDDFTALTFYPSKITKRKNTITIRLMEKNAFNFNNEIYSFPMNMDTDLTDEQIEQKISDGNLNFIMHGIDNSIPIEHKDFKKKYGIGLIRENCVIDPLSFKKVTENNQMISDYLSKKYGGNWLKELSTKPFGIK